MIVFVTGGRDYDRQDIVDFALSRLNMKTPITLVCHGSCPYGGADALAERWAQEHEVPYVGVPAEFKKYGRKAGPMRNARVLKEYTPDLVVHFPGGRGTADALRKATAAGIKTEDGFKLWIRS